MLQLDLGLFQIAQQQPELIQVIVAQFGRALRRTFRIDLATFNRPSLAIFVIYLVVVGTYTSLKRYNLILNTKPITNSGYDNSMGGNVSICSTPIFYE